MESTGNDSAKIALLKQAVAGLSLFKWEHDSEMF
jgi:hypothetical protein